jgi:hypothetical protein
LYFIMLEFGERRSRHRSVLMRLTQKHDDQHAALKQPSV